MKKIKISIKLFVLTIGLLLCLQIPTFAATGKSTATNVRVRQSASTTSEVIELLEVDDKVEILGEEGDWYKIRFNKKEGYVSQSFISTNEKKDENSSENVNNNETPIEQNSENKDQNNNQPSNESQNTEDVSNNNENVNNQDDNSQNNEEKNPENNAQETITIVNKIYKVAENTNVSILPIVTSEYIGEVKKNEDVTLLENAGLLVYIKSSNVCGWIRIDKLSTENIRTEVVEINNNQDKAESNDNSNNANNDENAKKEENTNNEKQESNYTPKTMYSKVSAVNVRSQANTNSDVVDSIGLNTQVKVVGEDNGWYKVEVDGKSGYIRKDLLSAEKTEVSSRNNDLDRTAAAKKESNTSSKPAETIVTTTNNTTTEAPKSSSGVTGNDIVEYAKKFLGCKYVYGAAGPNSFDCSGLTMYVYKHFGYSLSHSSKVQATQGKAVTGELQPGDILVFSNDGKTVGHVGIYIGNDKFIHASDSTTGVIISNLSDRWNKSKYRGARRIL